MGVARTTTTRMISSRPYIRSGRWTRSPIRPPMKLPMAMPPKKPVRIADTAWVVLPNTRTSCRAQTTSYTRPAAPDRMKMPRIGQRRVTGETPRATAAREVGRGIRWAVPTSPASRATSATRAMPTAMVS